MFVFLSKLLPLLVYPLGLAALLLIGSLVVWRRPRLARWLIILALALLWLGSNRWLANSLARSLEWQYLPPEEIPTAEVIVVLGGGTEPGLYPRSGAEVNSAGDRVIHAARLYHQGKAPRILVSGGTISWLAEGGSTPAEEMTELLTLLDVPAQAIWQQARSQNTQEDAQLSIQMLKEQGIDRVILVTSALHMPRAVALFRHLGIEVIPAPADYTITAAGWQAMKTENWQTILINLIPNSSSLGLTTNSLKEYLGLLVYKLRGWI
ncbi:MAG TPA: YdcF family protein [Anaerolineaceae bacterium]|nr:YdcF family protein [Anaerolineaceae bacterium]